MTREELDFIGSMNMCDEISNEAYKKIVCHCEEQEPCEDAISRQAVIDAVDGWVKDKHILVTLPTDEVTPLFKNVHALPPVNPQPKTGHWMTYKAVNTGEILAHKCNLCKYEVYHQPKTNFCPNCGAKMQEVEE